MCNTFMKIHDGNFMGRRLVKELFPLPSTLDNQTENLMESCRLPGPIKCGHQRRLSDCKFA